MGLIKKLSEIFSFIRMSSFYKKHKEKNFIKIDKRLIR